MESIKQIFKTGKGPSSSHTIAPFHAAKKFKSIHPKAYKYRVTLFSSMAATGKGHGTDTVLNEVFKADFLEIIWKPETTLPFHPNGMRFEAIDKTSNITASWEVFSIGGGQLKEPSKIKDSKELYNFNSMSKIMNEIEKTGESFWEYVERFEGMEIYKFLNKIWITMNESIERGIKTEGVLPGCLGLSRKANSFYTKAKMTGPELKTNGILFSYALAVAEENACSGIIVTAPTCGSSGVLPSVIRYVKEAINCEDTAILKALATAGLLGSIVKENASISGAEVGCQGEIGTACSMAAGAATQLLGGTVRQVEYAAEMALEHHLGLTCDPIEGLVQVPCIERNAHAAIRALSCSHYALFSDGRHFISFDDITAVMKETGKALPKIYRETSAGGLAKLYLKRKKNR